MRNARKKLSWTTLQQALSCWRLRLGVCQDFSPWILFPMTTKTGPIDKPWTAFHLSSEQIVPSRWFCQLSLSPIQGFKTFQSAPATRCMDYKRRAFYLGHYRFFHSSPRACPIYVTWIWSLRVPTTSLVSNIHAVIPDCLSR